METKITQLKEKLDKLQSEYDGQMGEDNEKVESELKSNYRVLHLFQDKLISCFLAWDKVLRKKNDDNFSDSFIDYKYILVSFTSVKYRDYWSIFCKK